MSKISLVVAVSLNGVIGRDGGLPWHISSDLKKFKAITMGNPIIMGRKTWESLPKRPLPGRQNIVITRQADYRAEGAVVTHDAKSALAAAGGAEEIAIIGGGEIYEMFLPLADRIYLTEVPMDVDGDTRFPEVGSVHWRESARENHAAGPNDSASFVLRVLDRKS